MPFDLTVNKQTKGGNGDPGPMTSNNYIMIGGDNTGGYFLRNGQVFDGTGTVVEPPYPEAVYKALENMSNASLSSVGFENRPEKDKPTPPAGAGFDLTGGLDAKPMQLNTPPGGPEPAKAEPVPQGDMAGMGVEPATIVGPRSGRRGDIEGGVVVQPHEGQTLRSAIEEHGVPLPTSPRATEDEFVQANQANADAMTAADKAHQAKIDAARKRGSKIDPSLLNK